MPIVTINRVPSWGDMPVGAVLNLPAALADPLIASGEAIPTPAAVPTQIDPFSVGGLPVTGPPVTDAPIYAQYPMVGVSQSYTSGTAIGTPEPTLAVQWLLDGAAIPGETNATYTPVTGDLGGLLSVRETWTNSFGSASADSAALLVTPAMAAATDHKYVDPSLGADDGGPFSSGDDYTPTFPLADGSVAPAGKIYATCKAAYDAASGDGHRYYVRKGYCHDPVSGVFFTSQFTRSDTLFSAYGQADADMPTLDALVYLDDATGWTAHGSIVGAWNYSLTGITDANSSLKGRLWVGRANGGDLTSDRTIGTERRRAKNLSDLALTNDASDNAGLWYVTAGSPSVLTVMATPGVAPPVHWGGLALAFENLTAGTARGIVLRNGASGNRVEHLAVQGTGFKPLGIGNLSTDSVCDGNAFVDVEVRSFVGDGILVAGATVARTVTNTYISGIAMISQSNALASDAGSNDFVDLNPFAISGFTDTTYIQGASYEGHNVHTCFEMSNVSNEPPANVFVDGVDITFLAGSTDGRAWGGFADTGHFKDFRITNAPARSQWSGLHFEVSDGAVIDDGTNSNKTPKDQFAAFKFTRISEPTGVVTADLSFHDITFDLADSAYAKSAFWFESAGGTQPAEDTIQIYNIRLLASDTQGLIVNATTDGATTPWADQDVHDNTIVNAALVGQNFSTEQGDASSPAYTTEELNGFFGCYDNTVIAA